MARSLDGDVEPRRLDRSDIPYGIGRVTRTFNGICSEAGVQCTIANSPNPFDPAGSTHLYYMKNIGDRLVMITFNGETRYIEPGEEVTLKIPSEYIPEVRTCNYGNQDA